MTESSLPASIRLDDLITAIRKVHDDPRTAHRAPSSRPTTSAIWPITSSVTSSTRPGAPGRRGPRSGASMGVSKQAAQKRFVPGKVTVEINNPSKGFERFAPSGRNVVVAAHNEASTAPGTRR